MTTSSAPAVKSALKSLLDTLYPGSGSDYVQVTYGEPDTRQADEVVAVLDQRLAVEAPTMATSRPREEVVQTLVQFSVFRAGLGADVQQTATERAWELYDGLAEHFRTKPNETLSDACRSATVTTGELVEGRIESATEPGNVLGRTADVTAVVTTRARI